MKVNEAMAYCPNCSAVVATDALQCAKCSAIFTGSGWKPLDAPDGEPIAPAPAVPEPESTGACVAYAITKFVLVALSLAAIGFGALFSHAAHANRWSVLSALAALGVIVVAVKAKVRWSFLVVFASVALGLASCFANFQWGGG